jgi:nucleoside phosphorylase
MDQNSIPYALGKGWTTDSFYRETRNNFEKHKSDGCISVDMECSAIQAMCDFRNLDFYTFFSSGDLLDAPEWDDRKYNNTTDVEGTQHDPYLFEIALRLADYVTT